MGIIGKFLSPKFLFSAVAVSLLATGGCYLGKAHYDGTPDKLALDQKMSAALEKRDEAVQANDLAAYQAADYEWSRLAYENSDPLYDLGIFTGLWSAGCFVLLGGVATIFRRQIKSLDL